MATGGGGVEPGERIEDALRREVREELGVDLASIAPLLFKDAVLDKTYIDGTKELLHMVFLVYRCALASSDLILNDEFSEAAWFGATELTQLPLSDLTRTTLTSAGFSAKPDGAT